jgi:hypothetical protein
MTQLSRQQQLQEGHHKTVIVQAFASECGKRYLLAKTYEKIHSVSDASSVDVVSSTSATKRKIVSTME